MSTPRLSFSACWIWYKSMLIQRPLLTKATTSSLIMSASDIMCQSMEARTATDLVGRKGNDINLQEGCPTNVHHHGPASQHRNSTINPRYLFQQDWSRTQQVAVTGFAYTGPIAHAWYQILESVVTVKHRFVGIAVRLLLDALIFSPIAVGGYFTMRTILECSSDDNDIETVVEQLKRKLSLKYWGAVEASWKFWPTANVLNFSIVPVPFRVLYNNSLSIFWNTYLTHLNGQRLERVVDAQQSLPDFPKGHKLEEPCSCCHCRALRG